MDRCLAQVRPRYTHSRCVSSRPASLGPRVVPSGTRRFADLRQMHTSGQQCMTTPTGQPQSTVRTSLWWLSGLPRLCHSTRQQLVESTLALCAASESLTAVLLLGAVVTVNSQAIAFTPGSPSLVLTYDWQITKTVGGTAGALTVSAAACCLLLLQGSCNFEEQLMHAQPCCSCLWAAHSAQAGMGPTKAADNSPGC